MQSGFHRIVGLIVVLGLAGAPTGQAQEATPVFLPLGDDPAADASTDITDLLNASIATAADELLVRFGLSDTSDLGGSYCWAFGYEADGEESFPVICAEFAGGVFVEDVGWTTQVSSSRGTQVPESYGEFVEGALILHIPLAAAGLAMGDQIDDLYSLTYTTRVLQVDDVLPDAKSDKAADESLGSYVIGASGQPSAEPSVGTPAFHNLTGDEASFNATFGEATSSTDVYAWNTTLGAAQLNYTANVTSGSVDLVVLDGANRTVANATVAGNGSRVLPIEDAAPGNWSVRVSYHNFTGDLAVRLGPVSEAVEPENKTASSTLSTSTNDDSKTGGFPISHEEETPGLGPVALLALVVLAGLVARRRLR